MCGISPSAIRCCWATECGAHTVPYIEVKNPTAQIEHEATTSKISDDQLFYAMQRGLGQERRWR
jgi:Fe-S cluster assembly protein SufB